MTPSFGVVLDTGWVETLGPTPDKLKEQLLTELQLDSMERCEESNSDKAVPVANVKGGHHAGVQCCATFGSWLEQQCVR